MRTARPAAPQYATSQTGYYPIIVSVFCAMLLISNVAATKAIDIGPLTFDGGGLLFPLTYILGDVLSEIYGLKKTRMAIILGFVLGVVASICFLIVGLLPPAAGWTFQSDFENILGFVPGVVVASLCGYLAGQFLNAYVLVKMKERAQERQLWARLVGSTVVGELADTFIFCALACTIGPIPPALFWNYFLTGYVFKCAVEIVLLPVTYRVIAAIKRHEPSYQTEAVQTA
ncbi:MAG: queuosine precursor transporter [Antricoccus sp.]